MLLKEIGKLLAIALVNALVDEVFKEGKKHRSKR